MAKLRLCESRRRDGVRRAAAWAAVVAAMFLSVLDAGVSAQQIWDWGTVSASGKTSQLNLVNNCEVERPVRIRVLIEAREPDNGDALFTMTLVGLQELQGMAATQGPVSVGGTGSRSRLEFISLPAKSTRSVFVRLAVDFGLFEDYKTERLSLGRIQVTHDGADNCPAKAETWQLVGLLEWE